MKISLIVSTTLAALAIAAPPSDEKRPNKTCAKIGGECYNDKDCCNNHCGPRIEIYPPVPGKCEKRKIKTTSSGVGGTTTSARP